MWIFMPKPEEQPASLNEGEAEKIMEAAEPAAEAAAGKTSDNNIWLLTTLLLGVDRAEVSSLKIWWNGSRRGNREFKGFHHLLG